MSARALIISVEEYAASAILARKLPGTDTGASAFRTWLLESKGLSPADIYCCAGAGFPGRTAGTALNDILGEVGKLVEAGRDQTLTFFFYFSGHGFAYRTPREAPVDVLIAANFTDLANGNRACLDLQKLQRKLWEAMGPGEHYFFVDACRNYLDEGLFEVTEPATVYKRSDNTRPSRFTLFSTGSGQVAAVGSAFPSALVDGLKGRGRAKGWKQNKLFVTFELLFEYIRDRVKPQEVEPERKGEGKGILLELEKIPVSDCTIRIQDAGAEEEFSVRVSTVRGALAKQDKFTGASFTVPLPPDDYFLEVAQQQTNLVQVAPPGDGPIDLYDPAEVKFRKREAALEKAAPLKPPSGPAHIVLGAAPHTDIELRDVRSDFALSQAGKIDARIPAGTYVVSVLEKGIPVRRERLTLEPGEKVERDLLERPTSEILQSILKALSGDPLSRLAKFDTIEPLANWDLSLWLGLMGASRVVGSPTLFMHLGKIPLASFEDLCQDESAIYLLTGLEKVEAQGSCYCGVSRSSDVPWHELSPVPQLYKIRHWREKAPSGWQLLSLQVPNQAPITLSTHLLPNRVTVVTVVQDPAGRLRIHQYILPASHLTKFLPARVLEHLDLSSLNLVRTLFTVQQRFAQGREVRRVLNDRDWQHLVDQKWLDPVASLVMAYDMIRHRSLGGDVNIMMKNLRDYFGKIPDVEAIARGLGLPGSIPQGPPLLLDGVTMFDEFAEAQFLPLEPRKIDYGMPWTVWRDAVKPNQSKP
jgi:hypothetical protein